MKNDSKGNLYFEIENIRVTYVKQINRLSSKNWPNADVLRFQAKHQDGNKLHPGAEYPVFDDKSLYAFLKELNDLSLNNR